MLCHNRSVVIMSSAEILLQGYAEHNTYCFIASLNSWANGKSLFPLFICIKSLRQPFNSKQLFRSVKDREYLTQVCSLLQQSTECFVVFLSMEFCLGEECAEKKMDNSSPTLYCVPPCCTKVLKALHHFYSTLFILTHFLMTASPGCSCYAMNCRACTVWHAYNSLALHNKMESIAFYHVVWQDLRGDVTRREEVTMLGQGTKCRSVNICEWSGGWLHTCRWFSILCLSRRAKLQGPIQRQGKDTKKERVCGWICFLNCLWVQMGRLVSADQRNTDRFGL